jgi:hypothetical protein
VQPHAASTASALTPDQLDELLMWQLLVAWGGERANEAEPRLAWWNTDLCDPDGGGDFLARLLPITHQWAGLRGAREAARRTELRAMRALGGAQRVQSLFWLDRTTDEALEERIDHYAVHAQQAPEDALRWAYPLAQWDRARFEAALAGASDKKSSAYEAVSGGRRVRSLGEGATVVDRARALVGALVPLVDAYPMPFLLG